MPDKAVWVLDESQSRSVSPKAVPSKRLEKNPALAFSLSLFFWGGGQIYNRQRGLGFLFILIMANVYTILALMILYWEFITSSLKAVYITSFQVFAACGIFYLLGLIFWAFNAIQSYHKAIKTRTDPFKGIDNRLLPPLCSFLVPGWGQFLNGQPKKGGCFLLFALAGQSVLAVFLLISLVWPGLDSDMDRFLLEKVLAIAVILVPLIVMFWGVGIYDAMRISLDPIKKEPLRKRVEYAINRIRIKGWKQGVVSRAKPTFALGLFLALSLILGYDYFPQRDYVIMLKGVRLRLSEQKMVLIPHVIDQFLQSISPEEPQH